MSDSMPAPAAAPAPEPTPASAVPSTPAVACGMGTPLDPREVLQTILTTLGHEAQVEQETVENAVLLHIATAEPGRLIGRRGQTLSQLQFLVNRILLRACADAPRVAIDCENYRGQQRDEAVDHIRDAADKVRRWGEPVVVGPFNAAERHAIQEQYQADPEIEVVSDGDESAGLKRLTIQLKRPA